MVQTPILDSYENLTPYIPKIWNNMNKSLKINEKVKSGKLKFNKPLKAVFNIFLSSCEDFPDRKIMDNYFNLIIHIHFFVYVNSFSICKF